MTVSTLRPDSTVAGGTVTGAASAHAALSDDSDSSYVLVSDSNDPLTVGLGDLTLPAGAVIKSVALRARDLAPGGSAQMTPTMFPASGGVPFIDDFGSNVTWMVATTTVLTTRTATEAGNAWTDADLDDARISITTGSSVGVRFHELYVDVTYAEVPVVAVDAVTDPTTTTNQPTISWVNTLDSDGGAQTTFEVKVFTDAEYSAGGFDPDTSTPTAESGETSSATASWQVNETLADDTYRAYVRVAQTVNGVLHWSDWDFDEFTISVDLPAVPTFTATADSANARITLVIDDNAGTATTDAFELQVSRDGGTTWETVRQLVAGEIDSDGSAVTVYDYEASNGVESAYRARALHDYSGEWAASAWATDEATWTDTDWWVKHPHRPDLNTSLHVRSYKSKSRAGRAGVFQALGSTSMIVVQDTRETARGEFVLRLDSAAEQDALDALLDEAATLLIQGPAGSDEPGYVRVLGHDRERVFDRNNGHPSFDTLALVGVDSPSGDVVAWP